MIWFLTIVGGWILTLTGNGWWWGPLMMVCAFYDVGWGRPQRERDRALAEQLQSNPAHQKSVRNAYVEKKLEKRRKQLDKENAELFRKIDERLEAIEKKHGIKSGLLFKDDTDNKYY